MAIQEKEEEEAAAKKKQAQWYPGNKDQHSEFVLYWWFDQVMFKFKTSLIAYNIILNFNHQSMRVLTSNVFMSGGLPASLSMSFHCMLFFFVFLVYTP